jgi:hypothetical protein
MARDLVLSSGFLAFARHLGVVQALHDAGESPAAYVGTSSGAVVAALTCVGVPVQTVLGELEAMRPLQAMRLHARPWQGLFSAPGLRALLERHLPATFAELPKPLAVGVIDSQRRHRLVGSGPLVAAVLASCAMPYVFAPVTVDGARLADGGAVDRLALQPWRLWRPGRQAWVHRVARTAGVDVADDRAGRVWIETPRSGASFWRLGDVRAQADEARRIAAAVLAELR